MGDGKLLVETGWDSATVERNQSRCFILSCLPSFYDTYTGDLK